MVLFNYILFKCVVEQNYVRLRVSPGLTVSIFKFIQNPAILLIHKFNKTHGTSKPANYIYENHHRMGCCIPNKNFW